MLFITVLKKVPYALVTLIESDCVACHQALHYRRQVRLRRTNQHVEMILHKHPGIQGRATLLRDDFRQTFKETFTVLVIEEDIATFYSSCHDMMN